MQNQKTPAEARARNVRPTQPHNAHIPPEKQAFVCGFCVYFRDVKNSFCHFTGEKVKFMDVACTYSMAVPHE